MYKLELKCLYIMKYESSKQNKNNLKLILKFINKSTYEIHRVYKNDIY